MVVLHHFLTPKEHQAQLESTKIVPEDNRERQGTNEDVIIENHHYEDETVVEVSRPKIAVLPVSSDRTSKVLLSMTNFEPSKS